MKSAIVRSWTATAVSALLLFALAACGGNQNPAIDRTTAPPGTDEDQAIEPELKISAPSDGESLPAGDVTVRVDVDGFELTDKLGQAAKSGEGHIHFYIDVEDLPTQAGRPAVTDDKNTYHAAQETTYTWPNVPAGEHTFGAQLVNNDHTPLQPPVTAKVKATVG